MWRSSCLLLRKISSAQIKSERVRFSVPTLYFSGRASPDSYRDDSIDAGSSGGDDGCRDSISSQVKKVFKLMDIEALKRKFEMEGKDVVQYHELLKACENMKISKSVVEAESLTRILDEAGVIMVFRDKVFLRPEKVVDFIERHMLFTPDSNDPKVAEFKSLQQKREELDKLAHRHVRRILWCGLGFFIVQIGLFFRLTFWEFSWDVMEPVAFFVTSTGLVIGYAYFLYTSRDPTYQDLMKRLFSSRQRKLYQKHSLDIDRFVELQKQCGFPSDNLKQKGTIDSFGAHN